MMKSGVAAILGALALAGVAAAVVAACTSSDSGGAPDAASDVADVDGAAICDVDQFIEAGGAGGQCPMVSAVRCFPCGDGGGCYCRPGQGGFRWQCFIDTNDPNCVPESGPRYDDTGTGDDASGDDASDAG
jgi:hypothetical protein